MVPSSRTRDRKRQTIFTQPLSIRTGHKLLILAVSTMSSLATYITLTEYRYYIRIDGPNLRAKKTLAGIINSRAIANARIGQLRTSIFSVPLLRPQLPFSFPTGLDKKSSQRFVLSQTSNLNKIRCRNPKNESTPPKAKDLHPATKNGTSRPLRPPCPSLVSRFEHHLMTLLKKEVDFQNGRTPPLQYARCEMWSLTSTSDQVVRKPTPAEYLSYGICFRRNTNN